MRYTAASNTDPKLTTLLETAQREPVFIERDWQEFGALVSAPELSRRAGVEWEEQRLNCLYSLPLTLHSLFFFKNSPKIACQAPKSPISNIPLRIRYAYSPSQFVTIKSEGDSRRT